MSLLLTHKNCNPVTDKLETMTETPPAPWPPGKLLKEARVANGYSKRQAADQSGLSQTYYRWIEDGGHYADGEFIPVSPTADSLHMAALGAGADIDAILIAAGYDPGELHRKTLHEIVEGLPADKLPTALRMLQALSR